MRNVELVNKLINLNYKICFAESCTGGMVSSSIVDVNDASKVLDMSFVTYANSAKMNLLGVDYRIIEKYGVVSEEVAYQMAVGAKNKSASNVGVGITGIAGPNGGTDSKPVGMVCFGFVINDKTYTFTKQFGNVGRTNVRVESTNFVIDKLLELLD